MTEDSSIAVGIVGLGGIGHHHAEQFEAHDSTLVGGMDINESAREDFAEKFSVKTYADADALFDRVDAVLITTPNRFHEEYAVAALEAGLDVLLEKPLAHTLESAERIATAASDAEGFCMVGFNNRFLNPVEVINGYQQTGRFGDLTHIEANYVRQRGIPGRGSWFTSKEVSGGGSLIDIGVHAIDLALYVLDFPTVTEVSAATRSQFGASDEYAAIAEWGKDSGPEGFDVDDSASAFIRTDDGPTISLEVAWATNRPDSNEFIIRGTDAGARFDRKNQTLTLYEASTIGKQHLATTEIETRSLNTHRAEQAYFFDHVARGEQPDRNTVEQALVVQRVIDAVYRSSEEGRAIQLSSP
ncbi:Gfo/Idh/MocA family protein [Halalkalirubrum salinum]|uniref:Gfo/Idh/MocA family protein n=1 Tax=Halalkalirubrum salinum TaxID=2563889 RepID=UPI0010FB20E1|nr:Gfo/Idh/MocA family oxidoreductase [Halalkalirubrum salinum]